MTIFSQLSAKHFFSSFWPDSCILFFSGCTLSVLGHPCNVWIYLWCSSCVSGSFSGIKSQKIAFLGSFSTSIFTKKLTNLWKWLNNCHIMVRIKPAFVSLYVAINWLVWCNILFGLWYVLQNALFVLCCFAIKGFGISKHMKDLEISIVKRLFFFQVFRCK